MNNSICTLFDNILIDIHKFKSLHILGAEIEGQRQGNNRPPLTGYFKINLLFNLKL